MRCGAKTQTHPRKDPNKVFFLQSAAVFQQALSLSTQSENCIGLHLYTVMVLKIKVYTHRRELQAFLRLINEEFWLASHPDNGAEPVHTVEDDVGVVHTADRSSTTSLSGGLAHTQLYYGPSTEKVNSDEALASPHRPPPPHVASPQTERKTMKPKR